MKDSNKEKEEAILKYKERFANPYRAAEKGYIDEIIMPKDTRIKLIQALEMAKNKNATPPPKKHGNMPL
ncbi:hypothetical protein E0494_04095 [Marinilabiliaceae bacterium JC040]|nr:hypothetical protein [Marinilabiliaceae bacterium JC040]